MKRALESVRHLWKEALIYFFFLRAPSAQFYTPCMNSSSSGTELPRNGPHSCNKPQFSLLWGLGGTAQSLLFSLAVTNPFCWCRAWDPSQPTCRTRCLNSLRATQLSQPTGLQQNSSAPRSPRRQGHRQGMLQPPQHSFQVKSDRCRRATPSYPGAQLQQLCGESVSTLLPSPVVLHKTSRTSQLPSPPADVHSVLLSHAVPKSTAAEVAHKAWEGNTKSEPRLHTQSSQCPW